MVKRTKHNAPAVAKALGRIIRTHRKAAKHTQEGLSFAADVDRGYLQKIEKGAFQPTIAVFIDIARALDLSPEGLLAEVVREVESRSKPPPRRSPAKTAGSSPIRHGEKTSRSSEGSV